MAPAATNLYDEGLQSFRENVKIKDDKDQYVLDEFLRDRASPEEVLGACKTLQDQAGEKYGSGVKAGDKEVIPAKWISNILGNIDNFVAVGNFAMKGAPESVGMAWFAVKLTLSAIQSNYALYSLFGTGLTDTTEILVLIRHYDRLYDERQKPGWKASDIVERLFKDIRLTYAAVLDFSFSIRKHLAGGKLAKLRHGLKDFFGAEASKFQAKIEAIGELKKKVLEATDGAFQGKTFQRFDELQDVMKSMKANVQDIKDFQKTSEEFYHAQLAQQDEIRQTLEDLKATTRPRTRWDWAKQEFEKNKKLLNPLPDTTGSLARLLTRKHEHTCEWLFEDDEYKDWFNSEAGSLLSLSGEAGVGKSFVIASAMKQMEDAPDADDNILLYLSCDSTQSGEMGDSSQNLARIQNTLIYQLYEYAFATAEEDDPTTLENCNKVFNNPKQKKVSKVISSNRKEETLPDFADAMENLAISLDKYIVIVVDAADRMTDGDQEEFYESLQDVLGRGEQDDEDEDTSNVRFLIGCRTGSKFYNHAHEGTCIDVGERNGPDIDVKLTAALEELTGWSPSEREEAKEKILDKAASLFKYVAQVAIPFIQQPFQRPLSNRLKDLPEGMSETYNQSIRVMQSNYLDLLRVALSYTLLAPGYVKVLEVMEAFSGEYLVPREEALQRVAAEKEDGSYTKMASQLEVTQLRTASGPFLNVWEESGGQSFVNLKDPYQVRHFCLHHATEHVETGEASGDAICSRCKASLNPSRSLSISEKQGHLNLAITCVRHLNSPLFQQRFSLFLTEEEKASNDQKQPEDEGYSSATQVEGDAANVEEEVKNSGDADDDEETGHDSKAGSADVDEDRPSSSSADTGVAPSSPQQDQASTENDDGYDTDDSRDDEDRGDIDLTNSNGQNGNDQAQNTDEDNHRYLRYEVLYWYHHVREAEALWDPEERKNNPDWATLMSELDLFIGENREAFDEWQIFMFWQNGHRRGDTPWKPIHIAAYLGLTSWAEHLIAKGESLTEKSFRCNPLQAAALKAESPKMLKLLLEQGIDVNEEEDEVIPAFHAWIWDDAGYETMQLMLQHKADVQMTDKKNGWTAMHYFASQGEDPRVLELLMNKGDPQNQPDINGQDRDGETPLHILLSRREVPLDLLKAFVANNANVNAEDRDSQRPLHEAAMWGSVDVMKIILPSITDIDDPDKRGRTALHESSWAGYKDCVQILVENGADPNGVDYHQRTPLLFACLGDSQHTILTIKFLLETLRQRKFSISDINRPTKRLRTPLRQAAAHGFTEIVDDLLQMIKSAEDIDKDAMINKADTRKGRTSLHCACYRGKTDCVRLLLEAGADVNILDQGGKTALVLAYEQWALSNQSSFEDIVDLLIDKDPAVAIKDAELLATAAVNGSKRILEKLHSLEADLNKPDQYGWTPLLLAKQFQRTDAVDFLKQQTAWAATLPSRWINPPSDITLAADGLSLATQSDTQMVVSANKPLPAGLERYYFEVTSKKVEIEGVEVPENPIMAIGFCTLGASAITFPGWPASSRAPSARSWAYHGDDGGLGDGMGRFEKDEDRTYAPGDTVGCGVDFNKNTMWFTKNGVKLDRSFEDVSGRLFPLLGVEARLDLETNFGGKPFVWQDDGGDDDDDSNEGSSEDENESGDGDDDGNGDGDGDDGSNDSEQEGHEDDKSENDSE